MWLRLTEKFILLTKKVAHLINIFINFAKFLLKDKSRIFFFKPGGWILVSTERMRTDKPTPTMRYRTPPGSLSNPSLFGHKRLMDT